MDLEQLQTALEAHEASDRVIDIVQTIGIGVCAFGIIVSSIALIYVGFLLRAAANTLVKDIRTLTGEIALNRVRLEALEFRLGIDRQNDDSGDADRRGGA